MSRVVARIRIAKPVPRNRAAAATQSARVFGHRTAPREGARNEVRKDLAVFAEMVAPCTLEESAAIASSSCPCQTCSEVARDEQAREAARIEAEMDADWEADRASTSRTSRRDSGELLD